ncbi:DUF4258 domain-containing protein [Patescibacteria group bacterium]|nr:DUF4258 domain-containing protein [Patescibacteria group bacterium]
MQNNYGGIIWTNHALSRMRERGIKQSDAWATWKRPDNSRYAKKKGAWVYHRTFRNKKIEVVAKKNEKKEWIVLSVWSTRSASLKPRLAGLRPVRLKQGRKKESIWYRFFKRIFGK